VKGRAETNGEKRLIIERLLAVWRKNPELRLGQLIVCVHGGKDPFYIEDEPFVQAFENWRPER
jgi:hypothetical protein